MEVDGSPVGMKRKAEDAPEGERAPRRIKVCIPRLILDTTVYSTPLFPDLIFFSQFPVPKLETGRRC